jgi:formylglycine-generating enzyme required for sulfatase activity
LWSARQLAEADALPALELAPREREFVAASRAATARTRWLRRAAVFGVIAVGAGVWGAAAIKARVERDRGIDREIAAAEASTTVARTLAADVARQRARAFEAYDAGRPDDGEAAWALVLAGEADVEAAWRAAGQALERALLLDGTRGDVRRRYAETLFERALAAEAVRRPTSELIERLRLYDPEAALQARWNAPGRVELSVEPADAAISVRRYTTDHGVSRPADALAFAPVLAPGSYLLELRAPGFAPVDYPVVVRRGETIAERIVMPRLADVPDGFVWIPPGRTIHGSVDAEPVRRFYKATPAREIRTPAFLIARHEVTFGQWIEYLEALPEAERAARTPRAGMAGAIGGGGTVALRRLDPDRWELAFSPGDRLLRAETGHPVRYEGRTANPVHTWERLPVLGISYEDAAAYAAWLDRTGRVPGARLCTEREWERAARGADDRAYPSGDAPPLGFANIDETYGGRSELFGPDEVGRHPGGRSPFGLDDMAGNVWEWVTTDLTPEHTAARGGSFGYTRVTAHIANRETPGPLYRDISLGMRLCSITVGSSQMK